MAALAAFPASNESASKTGTAIDAFGGRNTLFKDIG
jgi:hypothetical protein